MRCFAILVVASFSACSPSATIGSGAGSIRHADTITHDLDLWRVEAEAGAQVTSQDGRMTVTAPGGATIWFTPELQALVEITYTITAVDKGGPHDRVSDLNQFWMARDPGGRDLLDPAQARTGVFGEYDTLELYYVGVGGHNNTHTRFRRYVGEKGNRPLLPEHDLTDPRFLIEGNRPYRIRIVAEAHRQRFFRDGDLLFDVADDEAYVQGHFGLRTVRNHLVLEDFVVRSLSADR